MVVHECCLGASPLTLMRMLKIGFQVGQNGLVNGSVMSHHPNGEGVISSSNPKGGYENGSFEASGSSASDIGGGGASSGSS